MVKVKPVQNGRTSRMSFSRINEVIGMPNLIEIQKNSYNWFLDEGLREVFHDIDAIEDYTGNLSLEFVDYRLDKHPKYTIKECKERDATYAAPLYVTARLLNKSTGEVKEQEIFMGDFPLMTDSGTFISNGAERVIVSQLVRSPGVFYASSKDRTGKDLFTATMNPNRGAWLEYETDSSEVLHVKIDRQRKEFLSNVSHELKTPIALIQGYAEGLQDNINDDQESREFYCEVIIDEANKMNKMVKKLLTLNQIEFGSDQVHFERFDIVQVLRSSVNSATLLAEQKDAEILFYETDPVYVWADEHMIEEVITNYISNAVNHVDGERVIRVTMERRGDVERISVFNTGKTIPEEDLDKIWIKFYKVDKARTRAYGGNGIGLSIVKAIMDSMNQKCGVINHENGVEFWFELDCKTID